MGWNGSGTYTRTNGTNTGTEVWKQDAADGTKITTARHDTHDQDLAGGINNCLAKDGQNKMTGNFDMNGFSIYNLIGITGNVDFTDRPTFTNGFNCTGNAVFSAGVSMFGTLSVYAEDVQFTGSNVGFNDLSVYSAIVAYGGDILGDLDMNGNDILNVGDIGGTVLPWTPSLGITSGWTYTTQTANYTKSGGMLIVSGKIEATKTSGVATDPLRISGLPLTSATDATINFSTYQGVAVPGTTSLVITTTSGSSVEARSTNHIFGKYVADTDYIEVYLSGVDENGNMVPVRENIIDSVVLEFSGVIILS